MAAIKRRVPDNSYPSLGEPSKPPRISAYLWYSKEMRPMVKREQPLLSFAEVAQETGRRWQALSAAQQQPYYDKQERQNQLIREFERKYPSAASSRISGSNRKKKKLNENDRKEVYEAGRAAVQAEVQQLKTQVQVLQREAAENKKREVHVPVASASSDHKSMSWSVKGKLPVPVVASDDKDKGTCSVCMKFESCVVLLPCSHMSLCGACATAMAPGDKPNQSPMAALCPICGSKVEGAMAIFVH